MKRRKREVPWAVLLLLSFATVSTVAQEAGRGMMHAKGTFAVTMGQAESHEIGKSAGIGTMTIDKSWSGAITGTSKGEMLHAAANKAMVYVALEKMDVTVDGHRGTFLLMHRATMQQDDPSGSVLEVTMVPNSGTGDLAGIDGKLSITIDKSGHSYDFAYSLPGK
jgi:hypothetical protein